MSIGRGLQGKESKGGIEMKYPFQKKSFWIALASLFLIICLFPPFRVLDRVYEGFVTYDEGGIGISLRPW